MDIKIELANGFTADVFPGETSVGLTISAPDDDGWMQTLTQEEALAVGRELVRASGLERPDPKPDPEMEEDLRDEGTGHAHNFLAFGSDLGGMPTIFCSKCGVVSSAPGLRVNVERGKEIRKGCPFGSEVSSPQRVGWDIAAEREACAQELAAVKGSAEGKSVMNICTADNPKPDSAGHDKWEHPDAEKIDRGVGKDYYKCPHCRTFLERRCEARPVPKPGDKVSVRLGGQLKDAVLSEPAKKGAWHATLEDDTIVFVEEFQICERIE